MGWKLIDGPTRRKATRALAREFAEMAAVPNERRLRPGRLARHERNLRKGRFRPPEWAACRCKQDGVRYRVNGYHTSTLLAEIEPMPRLEVIVSEYEADTPRDVADLYATFDSQDTTRTPREIYAQYAGTDDALLAVHAATGGDAGGE